jgi:hypothetical protein
MLADGASTAEAAAYAQNLPPVVREETGHAD